MAAKRILICDDDPVILRLLQVNLELEGYEVLQAHHGEEALEVAAAEKPDLVILDIMMPGMDGLQVCHLLKSDPTTRSMPIILLSAKAGSQDVELGLRVGADDYLTKPPDLVDLVNRVRELIPVPSS